MARPLPNGCYENHDGLVMTDFEHVHHEHDDVAIRAAGEAMVALPCVVDYKHMLFVMMEGARSLEVVSRRPENRDEFSREVGKRELRADSLEDAGYSEIIHIS